MAKSEVAKYFFKTGITFGSQADKEEKSDDEGS